MSGALVATVETKIREDFSYTSKSRLWQFVNAAGVVQDNPASGMSLDYSQASGLVFNSGVTPNTETILRYMNGDGFETPVRIMFFALGAALLSQRIANTEVELRLRSADGLDYCSWLFDGTTTTSAKMRSANQGVAATDTAITSLPDTVTGSGLFELECWIDEVYWHARVADSVNGRSISQVRNRRVPDPNANLFLELVVRNLATAPASSTSLRLDAITVQDISELTAEITGGRGGGAASQAVPVNLITQQSTINVNTQNPAMSGADNTITTSALAANATFTQSASVDLGTDATRRANRSRFEIQATAATIGGIATGQLQESLDGTTWRTIWQCPVPLDGSVHTFDQPVRTRYRRFIIANGAVAMTGLLVQERLLYNEGQSDQDQNISFPLTPAAGQALGVSASYTSPTFDLGANHMWDKVRAFASSDQASGNFGFLVQQSIDGSNWVTLDTAQATLSGGNTGKILEVGVYARYIRVIVSNSTTAASALRVILDLVSL